MCRILIVDDNEDFLELLTALLSECPVQTSLQIDTAATTKEAIQLIEKNKYSIIVSDHNLGGEKGLILLRMASEKTNAYLYMFTSDVYMKPAFDRYLAGKGQFFQKNELMELVTSIAELVTRTNSNVVPRLNNIH
ncbi:MAG: response regulator [Candidatus Odinarchaeota archaeon]